MLIMPTVPIFSSLVGVGGTVVVGVVVVADVVVADVVVADVVVTDVVVAVVLQADITGRAAITSVKAMTTSKSFQPCLLIFPPPYLDSVPGNNFICRRLLSHTNLFQQTRFVPSAGL
jgi:hypothetical protein